MTQSNMQTSEPVLSHIPTQERGRRKVEQIVAATKALLSQKGIVGLRLQDVAKEAGVSMGALYRYFPTKEDLVQYIAASYFETIGEMIFDLVQEPPQSLDDFRQLFQALLNSYVEMLETDPGALGIFRCVASDSELNRQGRQISKAHAKQLAKHVGPLFPRWSLEEVETRLFVSMIMTQPVLEAALDAPTEERRRLIDCAFEVLLSGYETES